MGWKRVGVVVLGAAILWAWGHGSQGEEKASAHAGNLRVTYHLAKGSEDWPPAIRQRIIKSVDEAVAAYNRVGVFHKVETVHYNPHVKTAEASYSGNMTFGHLINRRAALHEIMHTLGVGQVPQWTKLQKDRRWTGPAALAMIRSFDGPNAVIHCDRQHFWPYGMNYDKEWSPVNEQRHVLMVAALRQDMGIGPKVINVP